MAQSKISCNIGPKVVLPMRRNHEDRYRIQAAHVDSLVHNRISAEGHEQYLVKWKTGARYTWHHVQELHNVIHLLQVYIDGLSTHHDSNESAAVATRQAQYAIQAAYDLKLARASTDEAPITVTNSVDGSRPPLTFDFINQSVLGRGVYKLDNETQLGCGYDEHPTGADPNSAKRRCMSDMGQNVGCEYARVCACLEYAAVDEDRLNVAERAELDRGNMDISRLPKRFPYSLAGYLQPFYLESRRPIYECNQKCLCGPNCKNRLVQHGRKIPLEIFKTDNGRGWGLRSRIALRKGQFIDTYRGEIITDEESTLREQAMLSGIKASYLYALDKFLEDDEDCPGSASYVVDGEFMGGPTRFINHSCEPNLGQYTVSYNKHDQSIYELAFFARRDIPALQELTFDYQDKDSDDDNDYDDDIAVVETSIAEIDTTQPPRLESGTNRIICRCGAKKCRGTLWL